VVDSRRFARVSKYAVIAYFVGSLLTLIFGLPLMNSLGLYALIVLSFLLGPMRALYYIAIGPGMIPLVLSLYVPATVLLAFCFWLSKLRKQGVRIAAYCIATLVWIAAGFITLMGQLYG
jgi:hypothetical protein